MTSQDTHALQSEVNRLKLDLHTFKGQHGTESISVGNYLLTRLEQLGVTSMFGVPGDFNLGFLDLIEDHPKIDWVGNCNELNAAYAADGYARVKHTVGVVLTTFGVGELSAINGIAGAFSEMVPVVHLVGAPSTMNQKSKPMLHHTLGDGRYDAYIKAARHFTASQAIITEAKAAASQIDHLLTECITLARPVYLSLPTDIVYQEISSERLRIPLAPSHLLNDPAVQDYVINLIEKRVEEAAGNVVVLVDACAIRHEVQNEVNDLLRKTGFPVYAAPMGKTVVDENYDRYGGIYVGSLSHPDIKEKVESARLIISIGSLKSDFNTGNFSYQIPLDRTIELHSDNTKVQYAAFPGITMKQLLPKLSERLQKYRSEALKFDVPRFTAPVPQQNDATITHAWIWPRLGQFFKPNDVIVTETGTSNFGILDVPLPEKSVLVSQILWGSIGWSVGSALGASLAARDLGLGRTILLVGDGSLQLTVQELSVMIRKGLKPIVFVLNNSGYTIERLIHGKHRHYNDISNWKWTSLLDVLGHDDEHSTKSYTVRDQEELSKLLDDPSFGRAPVMQLVEIIMPPLDAPRALVQQAELSGNNVFTAKGLPSV